MSVSNLGQGVARALPSLSAQVGPSPLDLKEEAIRLCALTGLGKRECARLYGKSWPLVRGWLNPLALDRCPPPRFVRWLKLRADSYELLVAANRELEAI